MKTRINNNSLQAFREYANKNSNILKIFQTIESAGYITARDISDKTGLPINIVAGRVNELMYDKQAITIHSNINNRSVYKIRTETDPLNVRPESARDKLDRIELLLFINMHKNTLVIAGDFCKFIIKEGGLK